MLTCQRDGELEFVAVLKIYVSDISVSVKVLIA